MQSSFSMARNFLAALSVGLIMSSVSIASQANLKAFAAEPSQSNDDQAQSESPRRKRLKQALGGDDSRVRGNKKLKVADSDSDSPPGQGGGPGFAGPGAGPGPGPGPGSGPRPDDGPGGRHHRNMSFGMGGMGKPLDFSQLGLTDDQKAKIKAMRSKTQGKAKDLQQSIRDKRLEMRDLLFDPDATEQQIRAKKNELRQMQDQAETLMIDDFLGIRSVLTAEQKQKLPSIKPDFGPPGGKFGRGPFPPGGPQGGPPGGPGGMGPGNMGPPPDGGPPPG